MEPVNRFFQPSEGSFFLFGPRGTGKSTFIRQRFPQALYIDLLDPERFRLFSARPERLEEMVAAAPSQRDVAIDEIQRVPQLLSVVHRIIESKRGTRFILTGSSARKLKRTGADLLSGRVLLYTMHPFMAAELGRDFSMDRALREGLLPVVMGSAAPQEALRTYAALYLREEVQMEGLVRNIGNFSRFLEAVSYSHASVLNVSTVARECQIERKVVEGYLSILEDLLLSWRLPVFTRRAKRRLAAHPKFYLFDTGVFRSLRPLGPLDRPEEISGQALEGLVAQHLRAWAAYSSVPRDLFYWRTRSGVEVDFVVYGPEGVWALEVKNGATIHPSDTNGLRAFRDEYPESEAVLLYGGKDKLLRGGIKCVPAGEFLATLHPGRTIKEVV